MPAYDFSLNPPAPIADVVVAHPTSGVSGVMRGKLDCGADITVIPNVLLGRNVLNRFIIILDGKALRFDIQDP